MLAKTISILGITLFLAGSAWTAAFAQQDASFEEEELLRLPGQGEFRRNALGGGQLERLIPGGGLLLSFDSDGNGFITPEEIDQGIVAAFEKADEDENGRITPLEQVKWAETLPTRDVSLANPARFDPNLDRSVRIDEFSAVIVDFSANYADEITGEISVNSLKSVRPDSDTKEIKANRPEQNEREGSRPPRGQSSR